MKARNDYGSHAWIATLWNCFYWCSRMQFAMNLFCSILIVVTRSDLSILQHYFHTNILQLYNHTFILVFYHPVTLPLV